MGSEASEKLWEKRLVKLFEVWKATKYEGPRFLAVLGPEAQALKQKIDQAVFSHYLTPKEGGPKTLFDARDEEVDRCIKEYVSKSFETVRAILRDNEQLKEYLDFRHNPDVDAAARKYFNNPQCRKKSRPKGSKDKTVYRAIRDLLNKEESRNLSDGRLVYELRERHQEIFKRKSDDAIRISIRRVRREIASMGTLRGSFAFNIGWAKGRCETCDVMCDIPMDFGSYEHLRKRFRCGHCGTQLRLQLPSALFSPEKSNP